MNLDEFMTLQLAAFCNMVVSKGNTKKDVIKWAADRFEPDGKFAMAAYETRMMMHFNGMKKPFLIKPRQTFAVDRDCVAYASLMWLLEECMQGASVNGPESFEKLLMDYNCVMVWKLTELEARPVDAGEEDVAVRVKLTPDTPEEDVVRIPVAFCAFCNLGTDMLKDKVTFNNQTVNYQSSNEPASLPVEARILEHFCRYGALTPVGYAVN